MKNPENDNSQYADGKGRYVLQFRPWIRSRTTLYEYFNNSWACRVAAEQTRHSPLAARLVGESFELALKMFLILARGPNATLTFTHSVREILEAEPSFGSLLRNLWKDDIDYVLDIIDEDLRPAELRYGAAAGRIDSNSKLIPSGWSCDPGVWTETTKQFYEELMWSLGNAVWENYPLGDRKGEPIIRQIQLTPIIADPGPESTSLREEKQVGFDNNVWGMLLIAEKDGEESVYWGVVPLERWPSTKNQEYFVRSRISRTAVADVRVKIVRGQITIGQVRIKGLHEEGWRLTLHSALAVMPSRGS